jgi:hypothetical protein
MRSWTRLAIAASIFAALVASSAVAFEPSLQSGTVISAAERLKAGEYLWAPEIAPRGPVLLVVSLATQRAVVYRNGLPIGITTVSTGRPGYRTPTGVFTVLQKHVEHYSSIYDNAPMPYMQRLTWGGVALHGGNLPGYPASHGCIRLPHAFARLLYGVTHVGMTVIVTNDRAVPRVAPADMLLRGPEGRSALSSATVEWHPERAPSGPVSIVVSAADRRAAVLRNGTVIGSAPIEIAGGIGEASAYVLSRIESGRRLWQRVLLPGQSTDAPGASLQGRITAPDAFRREVEALLAPGTTVVVTADSLAAGSTGRNVTVIEDDGAPAAR